MSSWTRSADSANEFQGHDTSVSLSFAIVSADLPSRDDGVWARVEVAHATTIANVRAGVNANAFIGLFFDSQVRDLRSNGHVDQRNLQMRIW